MLQSMGIATFTFDRSRLIETFDFFSLGRKIILNNILDKLQKVVQSKWSII